MMGSSGLSNSLPGLFSSPLMSSAMACTYPGRWYHEGMTVCPIVCCKYSSSLKICSSSRSDDPLVEMENCG